MRLGGLVMVTLSALGLRWQWGDPDFEILLLAPVTVMLGLMALVAPGVFTVDWELQSRRSKTVQAALFIVALGVAAWLLVRAYG